MIEHTHKYKKIKLGDPRKNYFVYRCMSPNCSHYIRPELIVGKISICWRCRELFEMKRLHLNKVKPCCTNCIRKKGEMLAKSREESLILCQN